MVNLDVVIDKLIGIEREKYNGLLKILELTKAQHDVILNFDIDELNRIIDSKQVEINSLERLDKEFTDIIDDIKAVYEIKSLDELQSLDSIRINELKSMTESIMKALKEVKSYEDENHKILEEQKNEFGEKLKQIKKGRQVEKLYQSNRVVQPVFFDKKTNF